MISEKLNEVDLHVDEIYGGSRLGNTSDDPLPKLLGVDNSAGFRHLGKRPNVETLKLLVLKTSFSDVDWPDSLDRERGLFVYYGDKRVPGDLHDTPRQGNLMLRNLYDETHNSQRSQYFPPILIFGSTGIYRDVQFLGLAVPGAQGMSSDEDLVAVWRTTASGVRFQNYKATLTILDIPVISRAWIKDIQNGNNVSSCHAPKKWLDWVDSRRYTPLTSTPSSNIRSKQQQLPKNDENKAYVAIIHEYFQDNPYAFEKCAMEIAKLFMPNINHYELTRPWKDGGRDALGTYRLGTDAGGIDVEFALEAKCYALNKGVSIKATSRLISRLRHRQFGVLLTTSYLDNQAYQELVEDEHPVVVITAGDISEKLKEKIGSLANLKLWLTQFQFQNVKKIRSL